jgi:SAM-dependent methyltransferase
MEVTATENEKIGQLIEAWFVHPEHELEATFGFKGTVDQTTFMNVAQRLRSRGYEALPQEDKLNIILPEHLRFSIVGSGTIQSYCRDNTISNKGFTTMIKDRVGAESNIDLTEYDVRIKTRREKELDHSDPAVRKVLESWAQQRKAFRLIQRWSFIGDGVQFDLSIVKSSRKDKTNNNEYDWRRTFEESRVVEGAPSYEIEVELLRDKIGSAAEAKAKLIKGIGEVLRGVQKNSLLIRNTQRLKVLEAYKELAATDRFRGVYPVTLEKKNMTLEIEEGTPNIRTGYNVTDKADGHGVIGYCDDRGELFMIDSGLNVYKTGLQVGACANSMVAGEWVTHDKEGNGVNHLLLFDIFYAPARQAVDRLPFVAEEVAAGAGNAESVSDADGRYRRLKRWIETWNGGDGPKKLGYAGTAAMIGSILRVSVKTFEIAAAGDNSIFTLSNKILDSPRFYHTDGLIYTSNTAPLPGPSETFFEQFKWKPADDNTIDFLVRFEKDTEYVALDKITPSFDPETREPIRYKTVKLYVRGAKGGAFANPRGAILVEDFGSPNAAPAAKGPADRQPVLFNPVEFPDTMAATAYVRIDGSEELAYTEKEEPLQDRSIVEMRYDPSRDPGWRWIPMRTRHDKTERLRRGIITRTMNAAGTAENIWNSIHDPVTPSMIRTGAEQPLKEEIENILKSREGMEQVGKVYYEGKGAVQQGKVKTAIGTVRDSKEPQPNLIEVKGLRDFHNSWIKQGILFKTAMAGGQKKLIDVGSGKGGDLNKWDKNGARFVLGIDYNGNNITDPADGAYKRYMQLIDKKGRDKVPTVVFVIGDGAKDWSSGEAGVTPEEKNILRSVFGKIEPDGAVPRFVEKYAAGSLQGGADVISAMFTLHYFFGTEAAVNGIINNIAKTLKVGGYFIGACFDGDAVVKSLRQTEVGGRKLGKVGEDVVWSIRKNYEGNELPANEEGLGMAIDVNFVSIGSEEQREFLVSFPYLVRKLAEIGVEPLTPEEQRGLRLKHTTAMFEESFKMSEKSKAGFIMPDAVKEYSFLNRWFIFKRKAEAGIVKAAATAAAAIPSADEEEMVVLDINEAPVAPQAAQEAVSRTVRANAAAVGAVASEAPIPEEVAAAERTVASLAAAPPPLPAAPPRTIPVSAVPESMRARKKYAPAQVVKFSFDATAREAQKLGLDDKAAAQWLAPSAPFDIPDPDDSTIRYPSLDHYIAGRKIMKATNRPDLARELMGAEGTIHRKFLADRMTLTGAGKRKLTEAKDKELLFLEANQVKIESTPEGLAKYGASLSLETWASIKDDVLSQGIRYRFENDARFRAILEKAKSEGKYLLYTGSAGSEYSGLFMTDGTIAGPNKMGEYMMRAAGYEV